MRSYLSARRRLELDPVEERRLQQAGRPDRQRPLGDEGINEPFVAAARAWLRDLPFIPVAHARKLYAFDTTYWTGWATQEDNYLQPTLDWGNAHKIIHNLRPAGESKEDVARAWTDHRLRRPAGGDVPLHHLGECDPDVLHPPAGPRGPGEGDDHPDHLAGRVRRGQRAADRGLARAIRPRRPAWMQYLSYLKSLATFDFGYSLAQFPVEVAEMIGRAMPWTVGLLAISTVISFLAGTLIGALMAWRRTPGLLRVLLPLSLTFTAIPFYILGIVLIYVFVFALRLFPISGGYRSELEPGFSLAFINSVIQHGTLPALSIVLASMGFWALGMRGMMITVAGEDYLTLARAKGLRPFGILFTYEIRNAILPQVTALVLGIGGIVGGTVLVEYLFGYPGMGALLYQAISTPTTP